MDMDRVFPGEGKSNHRGRSSMGKDKRQDSTGCTGNHQQPALAGHRMCKERKRGQPDMLAGSPRRHLSTQLQRLLSQHLMGSHQNEETEAALCNVHQQSQNQISEEVLVPCGIREEGEASPSVILTHSPWHGTQGKGGKRRPIHTDEALTGWQVAVQIEFYSQQVFQQCFWALVYL